MILDDRVIGDFMIDVEKRRGESVSIYVWSYMVLLLLVTFSVAQYFPVVSLVGLFVAGFIFLAPFFFKFLTVESRLVFSSVVFGVLLTALYPPFVGFFSGLNGGVNSILIKILLGLRSAFFSVWIYIAFSILVFKDGSKRSVLFLFLVTLIIIVGLAVGPGSVEPKVTYLFNSFLALFSVLGVIAFVVSEKVDVNFLGEVVFKLAVVVCLVSIVYFPILILNLDVFRPDLALFHQSVEGRGLSGALPPQWTSLVYGEFYPRFVGSFPNPILFGYFFALVSYVFFVKDRYFISLALLGFVFLSLSKGAILLFLMAMVFRFALRRSKLVFWIVFLGVVTSSLSLAYVLDGSNRVHLRGLMGGISSVVSSSIDNKIFGFGLGSGGNLARAELEDGPVSEGWLASGSESGVGVLTYQFGFLGLTVFLLLIMNVFKRGLDNSLSGSSIAAVSLVFAWFANTLLQEDLINVTIVSQLLMTVVVLKSKRVMGRVD